VFLAILDTWFNVWLSNPSGGLMAVLEQWWGWIIGSKRQIMLNTWGENMSS